MAGQQGRYSKRFTRKGPAVDSSAAGMQGRDVTRFRRAVEAARGPWGISLPLAAVVLGSHASGWSYRSIARSLELSRDRTMQLASLEDAPPYEVPQYRPGAEFPQAAVREFRRRTEQEQRRRARAEARAAATIMAAHAAGWPYTELAGLVGLSDERLRQMAAMPAAGESVPAFTPPAPPPAPEPARREGALDDAEAARLAELAQLARTSSQNTGRTLPRNPTPEQLAALEASLRARKASEELSAMIIAARARNVPWADLDKACGYRPGAARARALRHGHGTLPPSRRAYRTTPVDTFA